MRVDFPFINLLLWNRISDFRLSANIPAKLIWPGFVLLLSAIQPPPPRALLMIREGAAISTSNHLGRNYIKWDSVGRIDQYRYGWLFICDGLGK